MTIIEISQLHKTYSLAKGAIQVNALAGIDLQFERGEYIAIMGPSGSGKSTLLNVLGCLDKPTQGRYLLDGADVAQLDDNALSDVRSKKLGFIFQSYNLLPQLTVLENIEVPLYYQGRSEKESRIKALELAEAVGLADRIRHKPTELSGGQQQRVAVARALVNDPVLILADEPTGNLDSKTGLEILDMMDRLHSGGKTLVVVTHDDGIAGRAKRIIQLRDGLIESDTRN